MSTSQNVGTSPGFAPADVYFVVFRHKWKIITLTVLGLVGAAIYYFTQQPLYQSDAELLIRYVTDNRAVNPSDNNSRVMSMLDLGQNVMHSEMAILSSFDLAQQVATNVGPDRILAKIDGGKDAAAAASVIKRNLRVLPVGDSSVINVTFHHPDPDMVRPVLTEIIQDYQEKHMKVHAAIGIANDTLADQAAQLHLQISQTEDQLRIAKTNAGIISIADAEKSYEDELSRIRRELLEAKASLAEHQTSLADLASGAASRNGTNGITTVPAEILTRYKSVCGELNFLERQNNSYLDSGYTPENKLVKENRQQASLIAKTKIQMEQQYPELADVDTTAVQGTAGATPEPSDTEQVAALPLRIKELQAQFNEIEDDAAKLNGAEGTIADLELKKKLQEDNYTYYITMLDQDRIDEALGPGRVSNIQVIQQPSPPYKDFSRFYKAIGLMCAGGFALGLLWAFLIELYFDRSVKRPSDLQTRLRIPFFLSIPDVNHNGRALAAPDRKQLEFNGAAAPAGGALEVASPSLAINPALHSHYDALRDRLVSYFESINLTRKPKLVAVTSPGKGAGVSTISAGLAASLSETGDGRVLLVDMNLENGAAQQFVRGKAECHLDDALVSDRRDNALVQENLYVVSEGSNADKLPRILPKRFASLVPKLKASDYDYIIFDMPPVTQTSVTTRLAGFMDTVMLVVESEKTDRDVVNQANQLLLQSKANVTAVLNKTKTYVPARLVHDINADL
jgi:uncharacterized protein involved in exopolysaccharide biosynthesis/Mrp family chromosome partitioning ATPase